MGDVVELGFSSGNTRMELLQREMVVDKLEFIKEKLSVGAKWWGQHYRMGDWLEACLAGKTLIWVYYENDKPTGLIFADMITFPLAKVFRFQLLLDVPIKEIISRLPEFDDFAIRNQCTRMEVSGRKGWLRILKEEGYEEEYATVSKPLPTLAAS